jgi:hypothetical protein
VERACAPDFITALLEMSRGGQALRISALCALSDEQRGLPEAGLLQDVTRDATPGQFRACK